MLLTSVFSYWSPWKTVFLIAILSSPQNQKKDNYKDKHPFYSGIQVAMRMMMAAEAEENIISSGISIHRPGPALKEWRLNTNFDNVANWQGLAGHENCTKNIYEFPAWYSQEFVVTLPTRFIGKQIILPVNGHFVFQEGTTTFLPVAPNQQEDTCRGREVKFLRKSRADWYDPDNWLHRGNLKISTDGNRLLNEDNDDHNHNNHITIPTGNPNVNVPQYTMEAIPHLERVPCQYDSVRFPANSSFNLKVSSNVTITKFFLGDKRLSFADVRSLMSSELGELQFSMEPQTRFSITSDKNSNNSQTNPSTSSPSSPSSKSVAEICTGNEKEVTDSDRCICSNYFDRDLKQKICALASCMDVEDNCANPITPHGFCCPICGFHLRIRHSGNLRLIPLHSKINGEITRANLQGKVHVHLGRYKKRLAYISMVTAHRIHHNDQDNELLVQAGKLVLRIQSILNKEESEVIGVTLTESWGELLPSGESTEIGGGGGRGGSSDRLEGSGLGGGLISLIVILVLAALLAGIALFIFIWNKKGYSPLTLSSVTSALPRMPSMSGMRIPIVPGVGAGRRSSTLSNSLNSFGFARFTNERVSSVTIGRGGENDNQTTSAGEDEGKSSSIRRTEQVDDDAVPMTGANDKVIDSNSGTFGYSNVTYDLVAGVSGAVDGDGKVDVKGEGEGAHENLETVSPPKPPRPLLTIPEVTVVDMNDYPESLMSSSTSGVTTASSSTSTAKITTSSPTTTATTSTNNGGNKEESKSGKFSKPSFIASRMASAYRKLGPEEEGVGEDQQEAGDSSGKSIAAGESSSGGKSSKKKDKKKGKAGRGAGGSSGETGENKQSTTSTTSNTVAGADENNQPIDLGSLEVPDAGKDDINAETTSTTMLVNVEEEKIIDFGE